MRSKVRILKPMPRILPEEAGISPKHITAFVDAVKAKGIVLHSFIFAKEGNVFAEGYYKPYTPTQLQTVYSMSKSFTSVSVGMAVEDGKLTLNDKVVSFFGEDELPTPVPDKLAAMTIRHLLKMSTGQAKEVWEAKNWAKRFLEEPIVDEASGLKFRYNTMATYMCAAILKKVGIDLGDYLEERILKPLGIQGTRWMRSPQGVCTGGFGFSLVPELIAKFATLLMNEGLYEGKQLIPAWYVREATSKLIDTVNDDPSNDRSGDWAQGYGYQFWQCTHNCYRGDGMFAQFCLVSKDKRTVFAATSFTDDYQGLLDAFYDNVLDHIGDDPIAKEPDATLALALRLTELDAMPKVLPHEANDGLKAKLDGAKFTFPEKHRFSFNKLSIAFNGDKLTLKLGSNIHLSLPNKYMEYTSSVDRMSNSPILGNYGMANGILSVRIFMVEMMRYFQANIVLDGDDMELTLLDVHGNVPSELTKIKGERICG